MTTVKAHLKAIAYTVALALLVASAMTRVLVLADNSPASTAAGVLITSRAPSPTALMIVPVLCATVPPGVATAFERAVR